MEFTQVRPHLFTAHLEAAHASACLVVGRTSALLVDTGSSNQVGAQIRDAIGAVSAVPLTTVVASHAHWDHALGLGAFADIADTIGAEHFDEDLLGVENATWAKTHRVNLKKAARPNHHVSLIAVRDLGGITVEIAHFGQAHTRSDLVVAVPESQALIVGDLVEDGTPQFDESTSLDGWVRALDSLHSLLRDDTVVIPGHGPALHAGHVAHFRTGLAAIWDQAEWAYHREIHQAEVYDYDQLQWPWDRATVERGIAIAYAELDARPHLHATSGQIGPSFNGTGLPISPV
ncbi:MAG: MBL fold metallo-hydrolase [Propionibacteriaceae bacterium]|jgi:glyoxylase-like metal-dependent hydrolase (beta-lactamase superfamily II)|nr:MBL fold metallo-hydrolase [Propionibacteriaceae bacterium]